MFKGENLKKLGTIAAVAFLVILVVFKVDVVRKFVTGA